MVKLMTPPTRFVVAMVGSCQDQAAQRRPP